MGTVKRKTLKLNEHPIKIFPFSLVLKLAQALKHPTNPVWKIELVKYSADIQALKVHLFTDMKSKVAYVMQIDKDTIIVKFAKENED